MAPNNERRTVRDLLGKLTLSERAADAVATIIGSWKFLILQSVLLSCWVFLNTCPWVPHWDPYPFILMNLMLSMQAAYTAPVLLMSHNRQADIDRAEARENFETNIQSETNTRLLIHKLEEQASEIRVLRDLVESALYDRNQRY